MISKNLEIKKNSSFEVLKLAFNTREPEPKCTAEVQKKVPYKILVAILDITPSEMNQ